MADRLVAVRLSDVRFLAVRLVAEVVSQANGEEHRNAGIDGAARRFSGVAAAMS